MSENGEAIEVRLERLAVRLRNEGVIFGPERDLMVDAANLLRAAHNATTTERTR